MPFWRHRDELLRQPVWRICFERAHGFALRHNVCPYPAGVAVVVACAAVVSIRIYQQPEHVQSRELSCSSTPPANAERELNLAPPAMPRTSHDNHLNQTIPKQLANVRGAQCAARVLKSRAGNRLRQGRACFRSGEIRILDSSGNVERTIHFSKRTENCRADELHSGVETNCSDVQNLCLHKNQSFFYDPI